MLWARDRARLTGVRDVEVDFAVRDGARIAYEVFGAGPIDLVVWTGNRFPIDLMWDLPQLAEFMETLGKVARVIVYDPRGCGASDPLPTTDGAAGTESSSADLLAVLDATDADCPSILDLTFGTNLVFYAATHPERVRSAIVYQLRSSFPELRGLTADQRMKLAQALGTTRELRAESPRVAHDAVLQRWWGRARRLAGSPAEVARSMEFAANIDVEPLLAHVRTPMLVLARPGNRVWNIEATRAAASQLPNCQFIEVPGTESDIFLGDTAPVLDAITRFLRESEVTSIGDSRPLATVLFTDIVASTEQLAAAGDHAWRKVLDHHDKTTDWIVAQYRGRVVSHSGDGMLATFDGPARAVRCAAAIRDSLSEHGIGVRAGLHTGEVELRGDDVTGIAVHFASRVSGLAQRGEILVSLTVVDLTAGSGITYDTRGEHELKGIPGAWPIFLAHTSATTTP